jgi:hypothetical protein
MAVNGVGVAAASGGAILLYAGIKGIGVGSAIRAVLMGQSPATGTPANTISGTTPNTITVGGNTTTLKTVNPGSGSNVANKGLAQMLASSLGWTGGQFAALTNIINAESGGSATAQNASGALGIAQALGHGNANTGGTLGNEYGGYGLTDAQAKLANSGNARYQILWMLNYIKDTYGTPEQAWTFHLAHGWY